MTGAFTMIRNGRLVDLRRRAAVAADILIVRDVMLTIDAGSQLTKSRARYLRNGSSRR